MKTIRSKLILAAAALQIGFLGFMLLSDRIFLEPYYVSRMYREMAAAYEGLKSTLPPGRLPSPDQLRDIAAGSEIKSMVCDDNGVQIGSSAPEFMEETKLLLPKDQLEVFLAELPALRSGAKLKEVIDREPNGQSVVQFSGELSPGRYIILSSPLKQLRRNVDIAEGFFLMAGAAVFLLSLVAVVALSAVMVRPVLDMTELARRIAGLDFSRRYEGRASDELGSLGRSMNAIVDRLSQAFRDLKAANQELRERMEGQRRFLAAVSHEFKTPLGLARGYAEAIAEGVAGGAAETRKDAEIIVEETDRLAALIDDIILLVKMEGGAFSLRLGQVDLGSLLGKLGSRYAPLLAKKGLRLEVEADGLPSVEADEQRLGQAIDNLVSNAARHAREGSVVSVRASRDDGGVLVEVRNEGEPVPEEDLPRLFDPFYRSGGDRSRETGGSGLGLSIVDGIMSMHGGGCGIENVERGVRAWIRLADKGWRSRSPSP